MPKIKFTKMHGLGNDFIIINALKQKIAIKKIPIKKLAHRQLGIGFDQLILIERSKKANFSCRFFNADGSEAEQCGNGLRCAARFLHEQKRIRKKSFTLETKSGIISITIKNNNVIRTTLTIPKFYPNIIFPKYNLPLMIVSMGNPHAIVTVNSIESTPIAEWGQTIANDKILFPKSTNVGFMEIINRHHIRLRTYERGAGLTYACGSNACAAVAAGIKHHLLDSPVKVELELGKLTVEWQGDEVTMTGPAEKVFEGIV